MAKKKYTTSSGIKLLKKASKTTLKNLLKLAETKYNESLKLNTDRTTAAKEYIKVLKAYESKYKRKSSKASIQLKRLEITKEENRLKSRREIREKLLKTEEKALDEFKEEAKAEGFTTDSEIKERVRIANKERWQQGFKNSNIKQTYDRLVAHYERTEEDRRKISEITSMLNSMDVKALDAVIKAAGIEHTYYDSDSEAVDEELGATTLDQIYDKIIGSGGIQRED